MSKDGFEFFTQDFSIESGEKQPITAKLAPLDNSWADSKKPLAFETPEFKKWMNSVANLPAEKQVEAVSKKLVELNQGFDGKVTPTIENGVVTGLQFLTENVPHISPVRALVV